MFGISILAAFRPMGYRVSCCGSLGKDFLESVFCNKNVIVLSLVLCWQLESPFERGNFSKTLASLDNAQRCKVLNFLNFPAYF